MNVIAIVLILMAILSSATAIDPINDNSTEVNIGAPGDTTKRSWKCVIEQLARINRLNSQDVVYEFKGESGPTQNRVFRYKLSLSKEHYTADGHSKRKAQDNVAHEAFQQTHLKRPQLTPQLCVIGYSVVGELQEWASKRSMPLEFYIVGVSDDEPKEYFYECLLNRTMRTQAKALRKKDAKSLAAQAMIESLRELRLYSEAFGNKLAKYNTTDALSMNPISRLFEIQKAKRAREPEFSSHTLTYELSNGRQMTTYTASVLVDDMVQEATAENVREARHLAARNMLHQMGFLT